MRELTCSEGRGRLHLHHARRRVRDLLEVAAAMMGHRLMVAGARSSELVALLMMRRAVEARGRSSE
jgi:hypothetical protein